ncbi:MAG: class III lanthionine synthetase LanKC [Mycobacteriales bacterium]
MDKTYEAYCLADPLFYDDPARWQPSGEQLSFKVGDRPVPEGWDFQPKGDWLIMTPVRARMLTQGWKIHVSATRTNADDVLATVWDYCVSRQVPFKYLRDRLALYLRNAKYAPRGGSGKLVTIYPAGDADLHRILLELSAELAGQHGPYILSDLRWGDGPLYVRYGGFSERYCEDDKGALVSAIEDADGRLVPDRRGPVFALPEWVELPDFLAPHLAARNATTVTDLPYRIEGALHFSNGGGVYLATHTGTGDKVVLKEARPHAGLTADGADAVTRLQRERDILRRLAGLDSVPAVYDYFTLGDHHFLAQEYIEGKPLNGFFAAKHPLVDPEPSRQRTVEYTEWALRIIAGVEQAVADLHERGVCFNDLHMFNVMVRPDDRVALIDFEVAAPVADGVRPTIGNPGFVAPRDRTGFAIDRYALACLRLAIFLPMTTLFPLERDKVTQFADLIAEYFPVPEGYLDEAVTEILGPGHRRRPAPLLAADRDQWQQARAAMVRAILASATPERTDRLFPGDIRQFSDGGGLGLQYGAAGVLYALATTGAGRFPDYEQWLCDRALNPVNGVRLGLYDGLAGVAHLFALLGDADRALKVAEMCLNEKWERLGPDLAGGLAGLALALGHLARVTGEPGAADASRRAADLVAARLAAGAADGERPPAGLLHGGAGLALMFLRLAEWTGDSGYLDSAATALRRDLDRCVVDRNGALMVDEGWRVLPYLGKGSTGIGMVLDDYLAHRADERFAEAAAAARIASLSPYYSQPGLFIGRAGAILHLAGAHERAHATAQVPRLAWHAIRYAGGLAYPGDQLFRLSMDLGTGTAGVLLALGALLHDEPVHLPFQAPAGTPTHHDPE